LEYTANTISGVVTCFIGQFYNKIVGQLI